MVVFDDPMATGGCLVIHGWVCNCGPHTITARASGANYDVVDDFADRKRRAAEQKAERQVLLDRAARIERDPPRRPPLALSPARRARAAIRVARAGRRTVIARARRRAGARA